MIKITTAELALPGHLMAQLNEKQIIGVLSEIANAARMKWINLASQLTHSRQDYVRGIQEIEVGKDQVTISLVGPIPTAVELGQPQVDLRTVLLGPNVPIVTAGQGGPGKRQSKEGFFYRAIPFRHATPVSTGKGSEAHFKPGAGANVGPQMGSPYQSVAADALKMGEAVYKAAKQLVPTIGDPGKGVKWGGRLAAGLKYKSGNEVHEVPKLAGHHAVDIYASMYRIEKKYSNKAGGTGAQYMTFRTISEKNHEGWIRQAQPGKNLVDQVTDFAARIAPEAFSAFVDGLATPPQGGNQVGVDLVKKGGQV